MKCNNCKNEIADNFYVINNKAYCTECVKIIKLYCVGEKQYLEDVVETYYSKDSYKKDILRNKEQIQEKIDKLELSLYLYKKLQKF